MDACRTSDFRRLARPRHVDRAMHVDLGGLDRIVLVVNRRRRAGEVEDLVHLDVERKRDVVADDLEVRVAEQMRRFRLRRCRSCPRKALRAPASSRSQRCEPMKPAPPVTRMRCFSGFFNLIPYADCDRACARPPPGTGTSRAFLLQAAWRRASCASVPWRTSARAGPARVRTSSRGQVPRACRRARRPWP